MKEFFDLRSWEFKQCVKGNYFWLEIKKDEERDLLLSILEKERMSENDLLRVYFILINTHPLYLDELCFDSKMERISEERVSKFFDIVEAEASIGLNTMRRVTYSYLTFWISSRKLEKLVDIFLDEI